MDADRLPVPRPSLSLPWPQGWIARDIPAPWRVVLPHLDARWGATSGEGPFPLPAMEFGWGQAPARASVGLRVLQALNATMAPLQGMGFRMAMFEVVTAHVGMNEGRKGTAVLQRARLRWYVQITLAAQGPLMTAAAFAAPEAEYERLLPIFFATRAAARLHEA